MNLKNNEYFTYSNLRVMEIINKLNNINHEFNIANDVEIINIALVLFSMICNTQTQNLKEN